MTWQHWFPYLLFAFIGVQPSCEEDTKETIAPASYTYLDTLAIQRGIPLDRIKMPPGFHIMVYANNVANARSLEYSPDGTLFVGTRGEGNVYALKDTDGDFRVDTRYTIASGLTRPNGVAYRNGDLYVAERSRILRFPQVEQNLRNNMDYEVVYDQYPTDASHGWKYIAFGPDDKLYVPVGAPCNSCESADPIYASLTRLNPDGTGFEIVQHGIRNTVGFTWHPQTKELWFTDNGRDHLGDNQPACELNHASKDGLHFGYPYCHEGDLPDPEFGIGKNCEDYVAPIQKLGPHVAPLGLEFYTGTQFPQGYANQVFIAEHGSWNRSFPIGYRVTLVGLNAAGESTGYRPFATGWMDDATGEYWGRPVDIELLPDGSMLVSDDFKNVVYRIFYRV